MEKILIAIDGSIPSRETLAFCTYLSRLTHSRITAVVLDNQPAFQRPVLENQYDGTYLEWELDRESTGWQEHLRQLKSGIDQINLYFFNHSVPVSIHSDHGIPLEDILQETRYADIMVIDGAQNGGEKDNSIPSRFIEQVLVRAACPVVLAPATFNGVDEIVFAWDGEGSSVFALKQFTYLFPEYVSKKITVLHAAEGEGGSEVNREPLLDWIQHHYKNVFWKNIPGPAQETLARVLLDQKKAFVIFGAYGRGMLSRIFRHSSAETVCKVVDLPIFISHL